MAQRVQPLGRRLAAGLVLFLGLPAALGAVTLLLGRSPRWMPGFGWAVLGALGWVYGAVVGGGAPGPGQHDDLYAHRPRLRAFASWLDGVILIGVSVLAAMGLETALALVLENARLDDLWWDGDAPVWRALFLLGPSLTLTSFSVAFVAAALTRETWVAVFLALLACLAWILLPLAHPPWSRLLPGCLFGEASSGIGSLDLLPVAREEWPFLAGVLLGACVCLLIGLMVARRDKPWVRAPGWAYLLGLTASGAAVALPFLGELRDTLVVRDTAVLLPAPGEAAVLTAATKDRLMAAVMSSKEIRLAEATIASSGRISAVRQATLAPGAVPEGTRDLIGLLPGPGGGLSLVLSVRQRDQDFVSRVDLVWPPGAPPQPQGRITALLEDHVRRHRPRLVRAAATGRHLYALYRANPQEAGKDPYHVPLALHVFSWDREPPPRRVGWIQLRVEFDIRLSGGKLWATALSATPGERPFQAQLDPDRPDVVVRTDRWICRGLSRMERDAWQSGPSTPNSGNWLHWQIAGYAADHRNAIWQDGWGRLLLASQRGLGIASVGGEPKSGQTRLIGEARASWLSGRLRGRGLKLVEPTPGLVLELGPRTLLAYDVRDPTRPRRLGQLRHPSWDLQVQALERHLALVDGGGKLLVIDRPTR